MLPKSASLVLAVVLSSACLLMVQEVKTKSISESIDIDDFGDGDCDNRRLASGTDKPADVVTSSPDDYHLMMQDLQGQDLSQQNEALKVLNDLVFNESSKEKEDLFKMVAEKNKTYTFYIPAQHFFGSDVLFYSSVCAILFLVVNFVRNYYIRGQSKELAIARSIGYY